MKEMRLKSHKEIKIIKKRKLTRRKAVTIISIGAEVTNGTLTEIDTAKVIAQADTTIVITVTRQVEALLLKTLKKLQLTRKKGRVVEMSGAEDITTIASRLGEVIGEVAIDTTTLLSLEKKMKIRRTEKTSIRKIVQEDNKRLG